MLLFLLRCMSPEVALFGHADCTMGLLLSKVNLTSGLPAPMSQFDPKRTSPASILKCSTTYTRVDLPAVVRAHIFNTPIDTERRLVAIFTADVDGYSCLRGPMRLGPCAA